MKARIAAISPPDESPRYIYGKTAADEYVVFSPLASEPALPLELEDLMKFETVSQGPGEALNLTRNETIRVCIHDAGISEEVIRARYDSGFRPN